MDIPLSSDALDLSFHPDDETNLLAVGLISGKIQLVDFSPYVAEPSSSRTPESPPSKKARSATEDGDAQVSRKLYRKVWVSRPSKKSCRGLAFATDGASIYSVSKDKGLYATDTETGKVVQSWQDAHDAAPSRVLPIDETMVVTGDDDGVVRLWDPRKPGGAGAKPVRSWDHHFDWITDLVYLPDLPVPKPRTAAEAKKSKSQLKKQRKRARQAALERSLHPNSDSDSESGSEVEVESRSRLIVTSGDGSLSSIDLRSSGRTSFEQSEDQEDELLSITPIRRSQKLVVGTQLGILSLWSPAHGLLDHVDRVPGHPASVDTLVTLDDETVLTGSSDGLVRVVQILPSKLLGVIASHDGLPVERMKRKGNTLASIGHSNAVKLTDLTPLLDEDGDQDAPLGITDLPSDSEDDHDDDAEDDADVPVEPSTHESDEQNDNDDDDDDDHDDDKPSPPAKETFFADL